jgi:rSAM/selenodomain-associated transferase 1
MKKPNDSPALAAFVRTPERGPVKTRLAASWGPLRTAKFYECCLACSASLLTSMKKKGWSTRWAVAELEALNDLRWNEFSVVAQGAGGLGNRMATVLKALLSLQKSAIIIGSDSPQLSPEHLEDAHHKLEQAEVVIGPAEDGGFWLLGSKVPLPPTILESVSYSRADTRVQLVSAIKAWNPLVRIRQDLPTLRDVDTEEDALAIMPLLGSEGAQARLRKWLSDPGNVGTNFSP